MLAIDWANHLYAWRSLCWSTFAASFLSSPILQNLTLELGPVNTHVDNVGKQSNGQHQDFIVTRIIPGFTISVWAWRIVSTLDLRMHNMWPANFSSAMFRTILFETFNSFESLTQNTTVDHDISFSCLQTTSSRKTSWTHLCFWQYHAIVLYRYS